MVFDLANSDLSSFAGPTLNLKHPPDWLWRVKEQLDDEYQQLILVQDLAESVDLHPVYLARIFRKCFGCSIKDYLQIVRLKRAIQMVASGRLPLTQIAYENGFADQSHLNRQFRKYFRISPGKFRGLIQEVSFVQDIDQ